MVFSSLPFLCVFLPLVYLGHVLLPWIRAKNVLLVIASLLFYAYGEPVYVLLMVASATMNYVFGLLLGARKQSKPVLAFAIVFNLLVLGVFKYADMAVASVNALLGTALSLPQIALPIGISFFTFQAMSYVIDVYRGTSQAQRNYLDMLLYISFFPQLIAGPIVKYHDIAAQIKDRRVSAEGTALGFRRFCVGLGKKVLIANTCAMVADGLFAFAPGELNIIAAWVAALAYLFQIYFDFSGYSDMAIGMAQMFGFKLKENFDYPYASRSIQEFWRKWHISLSTWFKEYLYIPLGGNRKGNLRTVLNKFIVFFLCGLWHGASWAFVVWGLIHGFFLMFEKYVNVKRLPAVLGHIYTLLVVCLAFVIFRADSIGQGLLIIVQMFVGWNFDTASLQIALQYLTPHFIAIVCVSVVACLPVRSLVVNAAEQRGESARTLWTVVTFAAAFVILILCLINLSSGAYNPFIYFQF